MDLFFAKLNSGTFCAMPWMIPNTAISTTARWFVEDNFRSRSRPKGRVLHWRNGFVVSSRHSLDRNTRDGWRNWDRSEKDYLPALSIRRVVANCCTNWPAAMPSLKERVNQGRKVMAGKVYLVGAGPGDPELLTLKALRVLKAADVVLHDDLVGPEILSLVPPTAQLHNVGKRCGRKSATQAEINTLLVNYGLLDLQVVRLKGGDPLIFGRGGEEIEALRNANVEVEVIPGVTAALGAAAAAQIPLTHRRLSSSLILITNHHSSAASTTDWPASISPTATVVVYMPGYAYAATARQLVAAGVKGSTPCAIISQATRPEERVFKTTIEELRSAPRLSPPTLLVVGEVVRLAEHASLQEQFSTRSTIDEFLPLVAQSESLAHSPGNTE